jgi:hypothetical protein
VYKDELVFVIYRSVNDSSGWTHIYVKSWACAQSVLTSADLLLHKVGSVCRYQYVFFSPTETGSDIVDCFCTN